MPISGGPTSEVLRRAPEKVVSCEPRDPSGKWIELRNDSLAIKDGHTLTISVGRNCIHIGCTTLTIEAWRFAQKEVGDLLDRKS